MVHRTFVAVRPLCRGFFLTGVVLPRDEYELLVVVLFRKVGVSVPRVALSKYFQETRLDGVLGRSPLPVWNEYV